MRPRSVLAPALGYLAVTAVFCWALLSPSQHLFRWDTFLYVWPVHSEVRAQVLAGHLPAWADSFSAGTPLLANVNAGALYPLRILHWFLPLTSGYGLFLFAHHWGALLGMHLFLARSLGLGGPAAAVGALAYGLSGYARGMWDTHNFVALPWIPLGFAALLVARAPNRGGRAVLLLSPVWCLFLLGGDVQALVLWTAAAVLLAVLHAERRRLLVVLIAGVALGLLASAPQWLPTLETLRLSERAGGLAQAEAMERSFHPLRLLELVTPHLFGDHESWFADRLFGAGAVVRMPWSASFHLGLLAPLLVALALLRRRRCTLLAWSGSVFLAATALAFGRFLPGFRWWLELPLLGSFRYPEKYLLWSTFALALLAAVGARSLTARCRIGSPRALLFGWILLAAVSTAFALSVARAELGAAAELDPSRLARHADWIRERWLDFALTAGPSLLLVLPLARRKARWLVPALCGWCLLVPWLREQPTISVVDPWRTPPLAEAVLASDDPKGRLFIDLAAQVFPHPEEWDELAAEELPGDLLRIARMSYGSPILWGVRTADGFSPLEAKPMAALRASARLPGTASRELATFCRLTGVRWLFTTPARARELANHGLILEATHRFDTGPERSVLAHLPGAREAWFRPADGSPARYAVSLLRLRPGLLELEVDADRAGRLVVAESFDPGWRARDGEGRSLAVTPHEDVILGVDLPPGRSSLTLRYVVPGLAPGLLLAGLGLAAWLVLSFRERQRGRP